MNHNDAKLLMLGFENGFHLHYTGPRWSFMSNNLKSSETNKGVTLMKLDKEIKMGRILGPFKKCPFLL